MRSSTLGSSPTDGAQLIRMLGNVILSWSTNKGRSSLACLPTPRKRGVICSSVQPSCTNSAADSCNVGWVSSKYAQRTGVVEFFCSIRLAMDLIGPCHKGSLEPWANKMIAFIVLWPTNQRQLVRKMYKWAPAPPQRTRAPTDWCFQCIQIRCWVRKN